MLNAHRIPVSTVRWGTRTREDYGDVTELAESIRVKGLIQPIVLDASNLLVAGGRRLTAMISLGWTEIPYVNLGELSELQLRELELEENIRRKDLTWQEQVKSNKEIDKLKRLMDPNWTQTDTAKVVKLDQAEVSRDIFLATMTETHPELLQEKDKKAAMTKARRIKAAEKRAIVAAMIPTSHSTLLHMDALEAFKTIKDESVDLILLDPPYGVNLHKGGKTPKGNWIDGWDKTFDDSTYNALALMEELIKETARVLKPGAHCYLFFGLQLELEAQAITTLLKASLNFQRMPLIWVKNTHTNKDPYQRFSINYEPFYFCWKGGTPRDLLKAHFATFSIPVNSKEKEHPNEKPEELYSELISISSLPDEVVLDPTAGSGNSVATAIRMGRRGIAFEKEKSWFDLLQINIAKAEKEVIGK